MPDQVTLYQLSVIPLSLILILILVLGLLKGRLCSFSIQMLKGLKLWNDIIPRCQNQSNLVCSSTSFIHRDIFEMEIFYMKDSPKFIWGCADCVMWFWTTVVCKEWVMIGASAGCICSVDEKNVFQWFCFTYYICSTTGSVFNVLLYLSRNKLILNSVN